MRQKEENMFKIFLLSIVLSIPAFAGEPKTGTALFGTESAEGLLLVQGEAAKEIYGFLSSSEEKEVLPGINAKEGQSIRCNLEVSTNTHLCSMSLTPKGIK